MKPLVDVNLFVHNGAATLAAALDSVLAQTWPSLAVTVIDNASTDATAAIASSYAAADRRVTLRSNRANTGPVMNCQRAFWAGNADYVMPKTADDLLAPDFIAEVMDVLLAHPSTAMCHAAGLVFDAGGSVRSVYPAEHRLNAVGEDPLERARHVMTRYTSAPSFWGIYRRAAIDRLATIPYRAGWDHVVLAELALYGEIRSIESLLFWRRDGGKDVGLLARGCSQYTQRGLGLDDALAELRWRTPLVTTAYAHVEQFAVARLDATDRRRLMADVPQIFRTRWMPMMQHEAARFRTDLPALLDTLADEQGVIALWAARHLQDTLTALETIMPGQGFAAACIEVAALADGLRVSA